MRNQLMAEIWATIILRMSAAGLAGLPEYLQTIPLYASIVTTMGHIDQIRATRRRCIDHKARAINQQIINAASMLGIV